MNSLWHTIGGVCKYFRFTEKYVLWGISYCNLIMLLKTTPVYKKPEKGNEPGGEKEGGTANSMEDFLKFGIE